MGNQSGPSRTEQDTKRFDKWALTYDQSIMQRVLFGPVHFKMLNLFAQELKEPPQCIIDVGCGTGRLLHDVSVRWPKAQLFGIDPAKQMLSAASRLNPSANFKLGSAESLPFHDQSADVILSSISFHHWSNQAKGIQEIARVLRPGGLFCLADHIMPFAKLFGENIKNRKQVRELITNTGLTVRKHQILRIRFVLITLAQK